MNNNPITPSILNIDDLVAKYVPPPESKEEREARLDLGVERVALRRREHVVARLDQVLLGISLTRLVDIRADRGFLIGAEERDRAAEKSGVPAEIPAQARGQCRSLDRRGGKFLRKGIQRLLYAFPLIDTAGAGRQGQREHGAQQHSAGQRMNIHDGT